LIRPGQYAEAGLFEAGEQRVAADGIPDENRM
jgi:hypothetical protein